MSSVPVKGRGRGRGKGALSDLPIVGVGQTPAEVPEEKTEVFNGRY